VAILTEVLEVTLMPAVVAAALGLMGRTEAAASVAKEGLAFLQRLMAQVYAEAAAGVAAGT
jgi:hypothetical protein